MLYAIRHALRGIKRRKLKNLINTLGILIGVSLLAGVQIATDSLVNAMKETVNLRYGNADIIIQKGEYQALFFNYTIYETLKNDSILQPKIDGIAPRIMSQVSITSIFTTKQTEPFVTVIGIDENFDGAFGQLMPDIEYGNNDFNFSALTERQCIIGKRLAESVIEFDIIITGKEQQWNLPNFNPIEMSFLDAQGKIRTLEALNVKGIAIASGKGILNSGFTVYMKLSHLQALFNTSSNMINSIAISTTRGNENAVNVTETLENRLSYYFGEEGEKFNVDPQKYNAYTDIEDSIRNFRIVLYVFGSLIIISGILLILNITLMNIDERQRAIGISRAIGMTQGQLLTVLITESVLLGGVGSLLGLGGGALNGLGIIFLLENFLDIGDVLTNIPLIVNPRGLMISFLIGIFISLLAAIYPAWKAAKMDIVETINEIEVMKRKKVSGIWSIYVGITLTVASISALVISMAIEPDWRWIMFILSVLFFLFGLGFVFAKFINPKIAFNGFALSWIAAGLLSVLILNRYLNNIGVAEDMALYTFLIGMLGLVFGTIIFVALNLEWLSYRFDSVFQKIQKMRSIGMISMRYVGKKKTRSALTFAIFGVILTMNVFLAVFTGSFTLGFEDFAEREQGGVDIIAYSPFGTANFTENPLDIIYSADENIVQAVGMKFWFSLSGAYSMIQFITTNESGTFTEELPIPTDIWGINDEFLSMTEYPLNDVWDEIDGNPWQEAKNGSKHYIIMPALLKEFSYEEGESMYYVNISVGDLIPLPEIDPYTMNETLVNYRIIAFVETTSFSTLISNFIFTGEDSPLFTNINNYSAYLIATKPTLNTEEIVEISRKIEAKLTGFDTICLKERIESFLEFVQQAINFMQSFVSLGLVVGVLGLIIVSLRGITERTREIGMMRALGFQRRGVITAVVIEIFAVAFVGLVIGFLNGFILGFGMYTQYLIQYEFRFIIPWKMLSIFIAITAILSIIAAVIPARRAAKIPPSDALRYTG